jgi:hypothetical protein
MMDLKNRFGTFRVLTLALTALWFTGCDMLNTSMVDYFLDNTETVGVMAVAVKTQHAVMSNGTILIPPGAAAIGLVLANPRNFTVRQELLGVPAGKTISSRQTGSNEIEVDINDASLHDKYTLTLTMRSPDGLREFAPYTMRITCVSFETALLDFTVNGVTPPAFTPEEAAFTVNVPYDTAQVTLAGTTLHPKAALEIYPGTGDSGTALVRGTHKAEAALALALGNNYVYLKVTAPSLSVQGYAVTLYRGNNPDKAIASFKITSPVQAAGTIDEGNHTITVAVPYGTDLSAMTAELTHTGVSVDPDPGTGRSYAGPVIYTVKAGDGTTQSYTVVVTTGPGITVTGIISPDVPRVLDFSGVPSSVKAGTPITITIGGGVTPTGWYVEITGPEHQVHSSHTFSAPATPGFYNVNVIAAVDGIEYSGSFGLIVE